MQSNEHNLGEVDVDPTLGLLNHIFDCMAGLRDVHRVYKKQKSKATPMGAMASFGFSLEVARIMNSIITLDAFPNDETSNDVLLSTAVSIFRKFPEIATNRHVGSGKALIHHLAQNVSRHIAEELVTIHVKLFPELTKMKVTQTCFTI